MLPLTYDYSYESSSSDDLTAGGAVALIVFGLVYVAILVFGIYLYMRIARKAGWTLWHGLLVLVPLANIVFIIMFAFTEWPIERRLREAEARLGITPGTDPYAQGYGGYGGSVAPGHGATGGHGTAPAYGAPAGYGTSPYEVPGQSAAAPGFGVPPAPGPDTAAASPAPSPAPAPDTSPYGAPPAPGAAPAAPSFGTPGYGTGGFGTPGYGTGGFGTPGYDTTPDVPDTSGDDERGTPPTAPGTPAPPR